MTHVRLVGPDDNGRNLVVATAEGEHYSLPVTEELRALVTHVAGPDGATVPSLPPREVQRRIRAGMTAEELARLAGVSLESVTRYEAPVLAERAYITELARATRVGRDPSAPILGEIVSDRLAVRHVPGTSISWDAWRATGTPWRVAVTYVHAGRAIQAVWTFDHRARTVVAEDPESRWLTETEVLDAPPRPRHLATVARESATPLEALEIAEAETSGDPRGTRTPEPSAPVSTEDLLAELQAKRGVREQIADDVEDDEEFEGFGPLHMREADVGFAAGGASRSVSHRTIGGSPEGARPRGGSRRAGRTGRASMPSWDEIVFGAKSDD